MQTFISGPCSLGWLREAELLPWAPFLCRHRRLAQLHRQKASYSQGPLRCPSCLSFGITLLLYFGLLLMKWTRTLPCLRLVFNITGDSGLLPYRHSSAPSPLMSSVTSDMHLCFFKDIWLVFRQDISSQRAKPCVFNPGLPPGAPFHWGGGTPMLL